MHFMGTLVGSIYATCTAKLAVYCMLCMLSQPTGSLSFYKEVHDFMKQYSSDASKR